MDICNIIPHQGYGDLFHSVGIINYFNSIYNIINIYVLDVNRLDLMSEIFKNNNNILVSIPNFKKYNEINHPNTCIRCMNYGKDGNNCRNNNICLYINYNNNQTNIKIGSFNNISLWNQFLKKQFSFSDAFYNYLNLKSEIKYTHFKLYNNTELELDTYNKFINKYGKEYILIHEELKRNLVVNKIKNNTLPIINLNNISKLIVDYITVLKHAKEIHLIDSSWSVLIYLLSYDQLKNIPIYMNDTLAKINGRDTNIYKNPIFDNWFFY